MRTALGVDGIPVSLIKALGPKARVRMGDLLSRVLVEAEIPRDWKRSRVRPLYKGTGDRMDLKNCRPIAITPVLYRMAMQVVKSRLQRWAERKGVLGELQAGFRVGRRIEDNLFVLTQCIEIALQTRSPLYVAFLDISKAYDRLNREMLWELLWEHGLEESDLYLLQALYEDITAQVEWCGKTTAPVDIPRGLRQGCPLSPLLFMLCVAEVTHQLEFSGSGYQLEHRVEGQQVVHRIPALVYADDFAVMAGSPEELQHLLDICGSEMAKLQLRFS